MGCPTCQTPTAPNCSVPSNSSCSTPDPTACPQIINNYFSPSVCIDYAFNMPACGSDVLTFIVKVENTPISVIPVGAYLWSSLTGYLEVRFFDTKTRQITLRNNCPDGNAAPGAFIPAATCFIIVISPFGLDVTSVEDSETSPPLSGSLIGGVPQVLTTDPINLIFINPTINLIMHVKIHALVSVPYTYPGLNADDIFISLGRQVNGGGYFNAAVRHITVGNGSASAGLFTEQVIFSEIIPVSPGSTLTVDFKGRVESELAGATGSVTGMTVSADGLGVAV